MCFSKIAFQNITSKTTDEIISLYYDGFDKQLSFPNLVNEGEKNFDDIFSDEEIDTLFASIYRGVTDVSNLPVNVYAKIGSILENAVFTGFNGTPLDFSIQSPAFDVVESLRHSTWVFSGAKTSAQVLEIQSKIFGSDGFIRPFSDFKKDAKQIFDRHNNAWLQAEHQTAIAQSRSARQWVDITEGGLEFLQYLTVGDARVRNEHVKLDGTIKRVESSFWDNFFPPNGWRCRCDVLELEDDGTVAESDTDDDDLLDEVHPLFRMNAGKDKIVFAPDHPYFQLKGVNDRFKVLQKKNFGLPIPPPLEQPIKIKTPKVKKPNKAKAKKETLTKAQKDLKKHIEKVKPDNFDELGIEMPNDFWRLMKNKPKSLTYTEETAYHQFGKIVLSTLRRHDSKLLKRQIVAHEFGHFIHHDLKEIVIGRTSPEFLDFYNKAKSIIGADARRNSKRYQIFSDFHKKMQTIGNDTLDIFAKIEDIHKKYPYLKGYSKKEIKEMTGTIYDFAGALSKGRIGGGHNKSYYKKFGGYGGKVEVFAESMENKFVGNPLFENEFPELYAESIKYIDELIERHGKIN